MSSAPNAKTGKTQSQRIQIDYYRHRGGLYYSRWILAILALITSGAYAAYVIGSGNHGPHLSTGPLAAVHASFENDCSKCHRDFTAIGVDAFSFDPLASLDHLESSCQSCHPVAHHFRDVMNADWKAVDQNCSGCHADHEGRGKNLLDIASTQCTQCHSQLNSVCASSHPTRRRTKITGFTKATHGDFESLSLPDTGKIKFDHAQHGMPGQVNSGERGGLTLALLEPSMREKYRKAGQGDQSLVTLDCRDCHEFAGNPDRRSLVAGDSELGRYIEPIDFDDHCSACHSMNPASRTDATLPLPHAAPWAEVELLVESKINAARLSGKARASRDDTQRIPRPGEGFGTPPPMTTLVDAGTVDAAMKLVRAQCLVCHDEASITDDAIAARHLPTTPPLIPPRFLKFGIYDHAAHREVSCKYCHEAAYAPQYLVAAPPNDNKTVMIAGIESCTGCHRDPTQPLPITDPHELELLGSQTTFASDNCTMCHRYHKDRVPASVTEVIAEGELAAGDVVNRLFLLPAPEAD